MLFKGCYTALITPMNQNFEIDYSGLKKFIKYQVEGGVKGVLAMGSFASFFLREIL